MIRTIIPVSMAVFGSVVTAVLSTGPSTAGNLASPLDYQSNGLALPAGLPSSLPVYGGNDLALWFGSFSNDGVTGGPTVRVADTTFSNGQWALDPAGTIDGYFRSIIDLDSQYINSGNFGNIYLGHNREDNFQSWKGEVFHFDNYHIRLRQFGGDNPHPDQIVLTTDVKDLSLGRPGAIVAPRFAVNWPETGDGLSYGFVSWQMFETLHGWFYNNDAQGTVRDLGGPHFGVHYIGFYQNVNLWGEFGGSPPVDVQAPFNNMDEVLITFWGHERHWFGWHNGFYYGRVRFDDGNVNNSPTFISAAYQVVNPKDFSNI